MCKKKYKGQIAKVGRVQDGGSQKRDMKVSQLSLITLSHSPVKNEEDQERREDIRSDESLDSTNKEDEDRYKHWNHKINLQR